MDTVSEQSFEKALDKIRELSKQNATMLEALEQLSSWFDTDGYASSVPPRVFVFKAREAIHKANA